MRAAEEGTDQRSRGLGSSRTSLVALIPSERVIVGAAWTHADPACYVATAVGQRDVIRLGRMVATAV
jgi:hypothetical protein